MDEIGCCLRQVADREQNSAIAPRARRAQVWGGVQGWCWRRLLQGKEGCSRCKDPCLCDEYSKKRIY